MRRRNFVFTLAGMAAAWPLHALGQQGGRLPRIGVLLIGGPEPMGPFREALRELGHADGKNVQIDIRSAQGECQFSIPESPPSASISARTRSTL
jgi:hypothetical protein